MKSETPRTDNHTIGTSVDVIFARYVDRLERENANMKRAAEIQAGVFENTVAENTQLQTELTEAKRRIDELERKEYQLKKDNIESLDLLAADTALQNRLADQIERKDKLIEQMRETLQWYKEQVSSCNRNGDAGELARDRLAKDVGKRAEAALSAAERGE